MRVYQASWDINGYLVLMGVSGEALTNQENISTNKVTDEANTLFHPFACPQQQIEYDLSTFDVSADFYKTIEIILPSDNIGPFVSPLLLSHRNTLEDQIPSTKKQSMEKWSASAACLSPLSTAYFLTSFPANISELPPGIKFDQSILFWLEVSKFILDLLTRGKFIPGIVDKNKSHWHIVVHEPYDKERLEILKKNMPPLCRGYLQSESENPVIQDLVDSFISIVGDALIKNFIKHKSLVPSQVPHSPSIKTATTLEWLKNLSSPKTNVAYRDDQNAEFRLLSQKLKFWGGKLLSGSQKVELVTGFEIIPPPQHTISAFGHNIDYKQKNWTLAFFLTTAGDKTKRIYPEQLWSETSDIFNNLDLSVSDITETFLKSLATACNMFPPLKNSLNEPFPRYAQLTTSEAYTFLKHSSHLLEQSGYFLQLPAWWITPPSKLGLKLDLNALENNLKTQSHNAFFSANQLIDCSWDIVAGNKSLSVEEFKNIINTEESLVNINGTWFELNKKQLEDTLRFVEKNDGRKQLTITEALQLGYGLASDDAMLPILNFTSGGWLSALVDSTQGNYDAIKQPAGFHGTLRHYQEVGLSWLYFLNSLGIGGCLADDMGLGKTIQLLALLLTEKEQNKKKFPTLLVVPMSTLGNWMHEAQSFTPDLSIYLHHGHNRYLGQEFIKKISNKDIVITTYSLIFRDSEFINNVSWGRIVLDEAQSIKNLSTKQTQSIRKLVDCQIRNAMSGSLPCQRVALTGTPMENHLEELWSIMDFLNPGYLGSIYSFRSRFALPIERYRNHEVAQNLSKIISPFILRRVKTDPKIIDDLPEKIEMIEYINLSKEQAVLYEKTLNQLFPQISDADGMQRKGLVLATITKLKQICNHPELGSTLPSKLSLSSGKLIRLEELLETIYQTDDKVLIFSQFAQMGHLLKQHLQERFGSEVLFLHGALSKTARDKLVDRFQEKGDNKDSPKVFILSLKAGGLGLNLTAANQVIHFDQWWNPAVEDQATDRAFRIGQKRNVQVRKFICRGTLEERIAEMLKSKKYLEKYLADQIVNSPKSILTELSTDELFGLLKLTQSPIDLDL